MTLRALQLGPAGEPLHLDAQGGSSRVVHEPEQLAVGGNDTSCRESWTFSALQHLLGERGQQVSFTTGRELLDSLTLSTTRANG